MAAVWVDSWHTGARWMICFVLGAGSIYLLTHALKTLPIGIAYAVFTGIGAAGTVAPGIVLAGDPATLDGRSR